jgi:hypothetical protein
MSERHTLKLTRHNRDKAHIGVTRAPDGWVLELREPKRSDDQNDALHGLIAQILKQRPHHFGMRMTKESYKAVFMHALGREMTMLPSLDGDGFFPMGLSTSKLTVSEFSQLIEIILAWCAREGLEVKHFDDGRDGEVVKSPSPRAA